MAAKNKSQNDGKRRHFDENAVAHVCHYFFEGRGPKEIADMMTTMHDTPMSQQEPYRLIQKAIKHYRWLHLSSPINTELSEKIRQTFNLHYAGVTLTSFVDDVASRTAFLILDLLREMRRDPMNQREVHIGFSGGHTARKVFQKLANLLAEPSDSLPETIVCHALVAGIDTEAPGTDPTSFFSFLADQNLSDNRRFVLLNAPPIVRSAEWASFRGLPPIAKAIREAEKLDVIVTSAANFRDSHSQLKKNFLEYSPETITGLEQDGCIGDILWQPISAEGLLDMSKYEYRPVTILRLEDLPHLAARGKRIVLALGPCAALEHSQTEASKATVLEALLNHSLSGKTSITHLVVDSRTAQELMRNRRTEPKTAAAAVGSDSSSSRP